MVNGQPIAQRDFIRFLVDARGLPILQQLVMRELAKQETDKHGLNITQADIDREYGLTLTATQPDGAASEALPPARREQVIEEWTRTRGVSRAELALGNVQRGIQLKTGGQEINITNEMLRREYDRVHGEKVEVRHIQFSAKRDYAQITERLGRGEPFVTLVMDYSQNRLSRGRQGLLPPFTANDPTTPPVFARIAFGLKPGEVSKPIDAEGAYHILKLERRIPADGVGFEQARERLRDNLRNRLTAERMEAIGSRLMNTATIQIRDRDLRDDYNRQRKAGLIAGPALTAG